MEHTQEQRISNRHVPKAPLNTEFNSYARKYAAVKMRLSPKFIVIFKFGGFKGI